jgi:hypothetical protein
LKPTSEEPVHDYEGSEQQESSEGAEVDIDYYTL